MSQANSRRSIDRRHVEQELPTAEINDKTFFSIVSGDDIEFVIDVQRLVHVFKLLSVVNVAARLTVIVLVGRCKTC